MNTKTADTVDALLSPSDGRPASPEHRAWMDAQIRATLDKKARGEMTYHSLDAVRRDMGLDAS